MKMTILGSSSEGNCYILQGKSETLILEAGIPMTDIIKKGLKFDLSNVVGCCVTHEHRDHSKALAGLIKYGIRVLALPEVFASHKINSRAFCKHIEYGHGYRIGNFKIMVLQAQHDVPCVAFAIEHPECGRILFATDTCSLDYKIAGLNHVFIECNYSHERLEQNIDNGKFPAEMRRRLRGSHMELQTTKRFLRANDLSAVSEIVLVHVSENNGDIPLFEKEVAELTGKPVIIAKAGLVIEILKTPF